MRYQQGTGCLFTYDPNYEEVLTIHSNAFNVPNTYVRWEGRELFVIHFVMYGEKEDSQASKAWDAFCNWLHKEPHTHKMTDHSTSNQELMT